MKLIDNYNRQLNYLRISITDRCNLRCVYCVPSGRIPKLNHEDVLTYEEFIRVINIAVDLGITKLRVTGGEPLMRKGVYDFLHRISEINGLKDISLTTNAVQLTDNIEKIKSAGIHRMNISIDSLQPEKFKFITGYDLFETVWNGITNAHRLGFNPIKINVVALRGINEDEICDFGRLTLKWPFHVRFIEYMPIGISRINPEDHLLAPEIKSRLEDIAPLVPINSDKYDGPALRYKFEGATGEIGLITAVSNHFCGQCNRLRLTANGQLRTCLLSDEQQDLKLLLRSNASDERIAEIFINAAKLKQARHCLSDGRKQVSSQMSGIGG
ncbi:MAG: GTP 3',8-cyclase MoaA [Desulfobacteraceae bacterium]|nr:GTP 3',8-cyclase MoaA [Desulfobacteraceae bacterium]